MRDRHAVFQFNLSAVFSAVGRRDSLFSAPAGAECVSAGRQPDILRLGDISRVSLFAALLAANYLIGRRIEKAGGIKSRRTLLALGSVFTKSSYQKRNEWMVRHASLLIAVYNGSAGGTYNTIEFSRKKHVKIFFADGLPEEKFVCRRFA